MKIVLVLLAIFCALKANAQNYLISFAGTGASSTVNTVIVKNLITGTSLTLNGNDILHLTGTTGINPVENRQSYVLKVFPNPATDNSKLQISPPYAGNAVITVIDITGKQVAQIQSYLENSVQEFQLSGLNNGLYLISVKGNTYSYSGRLLSSNTTKANISIEQITNNQAVDVKQLNDEDKGSLATVNMAYSTGDRLKLTGISGNYSTVKTDIPSQDKTITFNFIACTDGDNNNYRVVEIGTQVWMAENLKTTKYNDGAIIALLTSNAEWQGYLTPGYCWYNNDEATYKATYGALYNWSAVRTGKLCPTGWQVPSDDEWTTLTNYLGDSYEVGGKLKETGTAHWTSPNTGATNETGFTALPGGYRPNNGVFYEIGSGGRWWSSTAYGIVGGWCRSVLYNRSDIGRINGTEWDGNSVRCLKD
ncbi:MAG: T9SS type A sorting domain-containing protein [Bacteroidales bacterium]|nr:T9SS type A sorting domain-containing protein [Bacteroidales bacterium]